MCGKNETTFWLYCLVFLLCTQSLGIRHTIVWYISVYKCSWKNLVKDLGISLVPCWYVSTSKRLENSHSMIFVIIISKFLSNLSPRYFKHISNLSPIYLQSICQSYPIYIPYFSHIYLKYFQYIQYFSNISPRNI